MEGINLNRFATRITEKLEPEVRVHLKNVYATVALSALSATAGGYCHLFSSLVGAGLLTLIGSIGFLIALFATPSNGKNNMHRMGLLAGFAFCSGCNLGPLLEVAIMVNPALIMEALLGTTVVFTCFSLASLYAPRGQYLYLGGSLFSLLSILSIFSLLNLFIGSVLLFKAQLYMGLAVMCGFVMYDTQLIIEKRRAGNTDFIAHGCELFIDFLSLFRKILIILTDKESQNKRNRKRN